MKSLEKQDPFKLGLVAFAVMAVLLVMVGLISVIPFGQKTYTAILAHTAGLKPGESVSISGVFVGTVRGIELDGDVVKVNFSVDKDIRLGSATTATVKVATLLGTHYVAIAPKGSGELANGTIPLSRTSVPYNLQDVLEKGNAQIQKLDANKLAEMLTVISDTLEPGSDNVGPALTGVARISEAVTKRADQTGDLLSATRNITNQLSDSSTDIIELMKQTNLVVGEITARRDAIHKLLVEAARLSNNVTTILGKTEQDIAPALKATNTLLSTLRAEDAKLTNLLTVMAPAVRYVANATGSGPWGNLSLQDPALPPDDAKCKLGGC